MKLAFWRGLRVLVTGGSGFVGSHVVELLVGHGARVTVTSRQDHPESLRAVRSEVDLRRGDLEDPDFCRRSARGQEVVLCLAGHVGGVEYNRTRHATLFVRNMRPFLNVLEAAHAEGAGRLLVTSSACVYPRDCTFPIAEREGLVGQPETTNAGYGWAKRMQEYVGAEFMREHGLPVAIARPFNAYGPRDDFRPERSHVIPALIRRTLEGENPLVVWGSGRQTRAFVYVKDFAEGLLRIAEKHPAGEPVNLGSREEISIQSLVESIVRLSGTGCQVVFDASRPEGQPRRSCDTTRMREVLEEWEPPTPLEQGLRETIAWYRETAAGTRRS